MVTFCPARQEDVARLYTLNKDLIHRYEDLSAIDYPRVLRWLQRNLEDTLPHFRRIELDGQLAGFFALIPGETFWEIDSLFVLPDYQGRGIGTQVLQHCRNATSLPLRLYVFRENTRALKLYQRAGFAIIQEVGSTRYIMEWQNDKST